MTTAAPPEKMTNAELAAHLEAYTISSDRVYRTKLMREAARRLSAPAPAAPRVGDDVQFRERLAIRLAAHRTSCSEQPKAVDYICADGIIGMFSAPPAASADESDALVKLTRQFTMGWKEANDLATELISHGYRKLAPAQSVGQSAAQGVGEFAAELIKDIEHRAKFGSEGVAWAYSNVVRLINERLSALPKGQEHEG